MAVGLVYSEVVPAILSSAILLTTGALLVFIRSVVGLDRKAILVNTFISASFLIVNIPFLIWAVWKFKSGENALFMFAVYIYYCSLFCNPVIYYATSRSFQQHTNSCFSALYGRIGIWCRPRSEDEEEESLIREPLVEELVFTDSQLEETETMDD